MNDVEKEKIREEARNLLNSFGKKLEKLDLVDSDEKSLKDGESGFRKESKGLDCDIEFRKRAFENAPDKNKDFIIAEKKKW